MAGRIFMYPSSVSCADMVAVLLSLKPSPRGKGGTAYAVTERAHPKYRIERSKQHVYQHWFGSIVTQKRSDRNF